MTNREKLRKQLSEAPKDALHPDRGTEYEQKRFLKGPAARTRETLLRQFAGEGPRGNSRAFVENWERIFGGRNG